MIAPAPSFEKINYGVRINKNIERKLIDHCLSIIDRKFELDHYKYIGFGSLWFSDFTLFHRSLGIKDMVSLEMDAVGYARQKFNLPFGCIKIVHGHSNTTLAPAIPSRKRVLVWLDYDSSISELDQLVNDVKTFVSKSKSGSILIMSLNCHHKALEGRKDFEGKELSALEYFKEVTGNYAPVGIQNRDLKFKTFAGTLLKTMHNIIARQVLETGTRKRTEELFSYNYVDGAPMITLGVMLGRTQEIDDLKTLELQRHHLSFCSNKLYRINAPMLTSREQKLINSFLPSKLRMRKAKGYAADYVQLPKEGIVFRETELKAYEEFYRFYPYFSETNQD